MMSIPEPIGGLLSGWIRGSADGFHGLQGWQWVFLLEGLPTCPLGIAAYFYLDENAPKAAKWFR